MELFISGAGDVVSGGFSGGVGCEVSLSAAIGGASSSLRGLLSWVPVRPGVLGRGCCSCLATMAALRSAGHTDVRTFNGTWTSKARHISIICSGGSKPKYVLLSAWYSDSVRLCESLRH